MRVQPIDAPGCLLSILIAPLVLPQSQWSLGVFVKVLFCAPALALIAGSALAEPQQVRKGPVPSDVTP